MPMRFSACSRSMTAFPSSRAVRVPPSLLFSTPAILRNAQLCGKRQLLPAEVWRITVKAQTHHGCAKVALPASKYVPVMF
jgi:hypothetical protein